jgi:hypothetical protein
VVDLEAIFVDHTNLNQFGFALTGNYKYVAKSCILRQGSACLNKSRTLRPELSLAPALNLKN